MKGQSAIEYLVTYGWMLIAVGIVSSVAYSTFQPECQTSTSNFIGDDIRIGDEAITTDENFEILMENVRVEEVTVTSVVIDTGDDVVERERDVLIPGGDSETYEVASIDFDSEECVDAGITLNYDIGSLEGQSSSGSATIPASLIESIENFLSIGGGEIPSVKVNSSVTLSPESPDDSLCIGSDCQEIRTANDNPVQRDGDIMEGTTLTEEMSFECIGNECSIEDGEAEGELSNQINDMDGTLQVTGIQPLDGGLCLGDC